MNFYIELSIKYIDFKKNLKKRENYCNEIIYLIQGHYLFICKCNDSKNKKRFSSSNFFCGFNFTTYA